MESKVGGRAFNIVIAILAILLGLYVLAGGILGAGFGAGFLGYVYVFGGLFIISVGISMIRKRNIPSEASKPNLGRAIVLGILIFIPLMYTVLNIFDF